MPREYVPSPGDIVWISFDPQAGHEQAGHRPAVVLSPASYNSRTSLMLCCPMTTQIKNYIFEVPVAGERPSVVLADQVKSLDWAEPGCQTERPRLSGGLGRSACEDTRAHWVTAPRETQANTLRQYRTPFLLRMRPCGQRRNRVRERVVG